MRHPLLPFRWDMSSVAVVRRMGRGLRSLIPGETRERLLRCATEVLAEADDADLAFVGRSPESIHDFLRGALARTRFAERLQLLQLSLRDAPRRLRHERPEALERLRRYLEAAGLAPHAIASRPRPIAFVDLVWSGQTLRNLSMALHQFTDGDARLWRSVRDKLRWICIVESERGWDGWRPDESHWTRLYAWSQFRRVAIEWRFWRFLGEEQQKTTDSYTIEDWGEDNAEELDGYRFEAIRRARAVFRLGECWRDRLAVGLEARRNSGASALWVGELLRELRLR